MDANAIFNEAFGRGREPRSSQYKRGVLECL
jgi:hypothetical protein